MPSERCGDCIHFSDNPNYPATDWKYCVYGRLGDCSEIRGMKTPLKNKQEVVVFSKLHPKHNLELNDVEPQIIQIVVGDPSGISCYIPRTREVVLYQPALAEA